MAGDWSRSERVEASPIVIWEIEATSTQSKSLIPGYLSHEHEAVAIGEATVRFDADGIIRAVDALYQIQDTQESSGGTTTYQSGYRVGSIGETSVSQPSWLATARERAPQSQRH